MQESDLQTILKRKNYGISGGIKSGIKEGIGSKARDQREVSKLERRLGHEPIRAPGLAIPYSGQCAVSIKVYRKRLTDPLGDAHKYHIDGLRYIGFLADDSDRAIRLTDEGHEKVATDQEERVEVTIEYYGINLDDLCEAYKNGPRKIEK